MEIEMSQSRLGCKVKVLHESIENGGKGVQVVDNARDVALLFTASAPPPVIVESSESSDVDSSELEYYSASDDDVNDQQDQQDQYDQQDYL
jgi:hypothetical protein